MKNIDKKLNNKNTELPYNSKCKVHNEIAKSIAQTHYTNEYMKMKLSPFYFLVQVSTVRENML